MLDIYVGRQPIYDRLKNVHAYELVFRNSLHNAAGIVDGDSATSQVLLNTFMEIGLENIVGDKLAFVNMTRNFLLGDYSMPFPKDRVVLEILEHVTVDDELCANVRELVEAGFVFALDDFVYDEAYHPLLELVRYVKLDVLALSEAQLRSHARELRRFETTLLAEKVEDAETFELCTELGFQLFQGYYFSRPQIISGKRIPANRVSSLQLLAKLNEPDADIDELETILNRDVALSYKMLRYINSGFFALRAKVESVRQALVLLGRETIKNWAVLVVLAGFDDKPSELTVTAMVRGRMCELLAGAVGMDQREAFTTGLFSVLDSLMDCPMEQVVGDLPLSDDISRALVERRGKLGDILRAVLAYEAGDLEELESVALVQDVPVRDVFLEAVSWATDAATSLTPALSG